VKALQDIYPEIRQAGASLIAISPMLPDGSLTMAEKHQLSFDVLSDRGNRVAVEYGIVFRLDDELLKLYDKFGIDVAGANGDDSFELPVPATYLVNSDRWISYAFLDVDHTVRMEPADIVAQLKKL
jgi:peroxiredoxin